MLNYAVRLDKIRRLNDTSVEILKLLAKSLGGNPGRVEYGFIGEQLGMPRSTVSSSMRALIRDGTVELIGDELYVGNSIIWFEE